MMATGYSIILKFLLKRNKLFEFLRSVGKKFPNEMPLYCHESLEVEKFTRGINKSFLF